MPYSIRPLYMDDLPETMAVWESSVLASHDFLSPEDYDFFHDLVHRVLQQVLPKRGSIQRLLFPHIQASPFHGLFNDEGALCGLLCVQNGSIIALFIHGDMRRQGCGSELMRYALNTLGAVKVSVNEQNPPAIRFYKKWGFTVYKRTELDQCGKPYPILYMQRTV